MKSVMTPPHANQNFRTVAYAIARDKGQRILLNLVAAAAVTTVFAVKASETDNQRLSANPPVVAGTDGPLIP